MRNRSPANSDGLVAAGAGADFHDDVALVHRVLGDERETDLLRQRVALPVERGLLALGERAHLAVGRAVGEHRVEIGDLGCRSRGRLLMVSTSGCSSENSRDSFT